MRASWVFGILLIGTTLNYAFYVQQQRAADAPCRQLAGYSEVQLRSFIDRQWDNLRVLRITRHREDLHSQPGRMDELGRMQKRVLASISGAEAELARRGLGEPSLQPMPAKRVASVVNSLVQ